MHPYPSSCSFIRSDEDDAADSWEVRLAKRYYRWGAQHSTALCSAAAPTLSLRSSPTPTNPSLWCKALELTPA